MSWQAFTMYLADARREQRKLGGKVETAWGKPPPQAVLDQMALGNDTTPPDAWTDVDG